MKNEKICVRQVEPEMQDLSIYLDCYVDMDSIIIRGNRDFMGHTTEEYKNINIVLNELEYFLCVYRGRGLSEFCNEMFPRELPYLSEEIIRWKKLLRNVIRNGVTKGSICDALSLVYAREYECVTIRGCCQGEWQYLYYPAEYDDETVKEIESLYFNLGDEWIVDDYGIAIATVANDDFNIKTEISEATGFEPENIELYTFAGYDMYPRYEVM